MKRFLIIIIILNIKFNVFSQTSPRVYYNIPNGWTDVNLFGKIKGKVSWQLENHHRRVDMHGEYNEATTTGNPYNTLNQHIIRPYIHYQANSNIRFTLMALGWMGTNKFRNGMPNSFFPELRVSPQIILTHNLGRVRIDNRMRYEMRWLGADQAVNKKIIVYGGDFSNATYRHRYRHHFKVSFPINKPKMEDKTLYFQAINESFINFGKNVANNNLFDQNRILVGMGYRFTKFVTLEAGFMRQSIYRFNNVDKNNVDRNNILQTNIAVSNIDVLFKKKTPAK